jgi:hypothetical protein
VKTRPIVISLVLVGAIPGCKGAARSTSGDAQTQTPTSGGGDDGSDLPREASVAGAADADAIPDDAILPANSEELVVRARHLLEAIAQDEPSLASDILFPRDGWLATRDSADPGKDWERQVADPFRRSLHAMSRHWPSPDHAQVTSLELGRLLVQATPRKHGWKKPLWMVSGSRLTFAVDGHPRSVTIREMAAWRGAWYVTRLR